MTRVDLRQKAFAEVPVNVHVRKINTIHFKQEEGATEFVTSCSDGSVSIWDIRRFGPKAKSVADLSHAKSCHGALSKHSNFENTGIPCACLHKLQAPLFMLGACTGSSRLGHGKVL